MPTNSNGIVTARDALTVDADKQALWKRVREFSALDAEAARHKYGLGKDARDWTVAGAQQDIRNHLDETRLTPVSYRPFDTLWTFYTGKSRGFICYPRNDVMGNYLRGDNIGLLSSKGVKDAHFAHAFLTTHISEAIFLSATTGSNAMNFPLYLYPDGEVDRLNRIVNFDSNLFGEMRELTRDIEHGEADEVAVFDYIYGMLHSPSYRSTYNEFLKIDFPRIPWPQSPRQFWHISSRGGELRRLHLMDTTAIGATPFPFAGEGDDIVEKPELRDGRIWINVNQCFDEVPPEAWRFWIGGYQPAQKWLKDRRDQALSFEEIRHYQRILKVLSETMRIMAEIDV